jgi:hypothetical protein
MVRECLDGQEMDRNGVAAEGVEDQQVERFAIAGP